MAPGFKELINADISNVFLNLDEFADTHNVDGRDMSVLIDDNELLERDKGKMGVHMDGSYKVRRLMYVEKSVFGPRPAQNRLLTLDGRQYQVKACAEEDGILSIELEAVRT